MPTTPAHPTRLGDQVIYHAPTSPGSKTSYPVAAMVTMTHDEWVDGADVEQPAVDRVHLNVMWPPTADGSKLPSSLAHVAYGTDLGQWTER